MVFTSGERAARCSHHSLSTKAEIGPRTLEKCSIGTSLQIISLRWKPRNHRRCNFPPDNGGILQGSEKYVPGQITLSAVNEENFDGNVNEILINYWGQKWTIFLFTLVCRVLRLSNFKWIHKVTLEIFLKEKNCLQIYQRIRVLKYLFLFLLTKYLFSRLIRNPLYTFKHN